MYIAVTCEIGGENKKVTVEVTAEEIGRLRAVKEMPTVGFVVIEASDGSQFRFLANSIRIVEIGTTRSTRSR